MPPPCGGCIHPDRSDLDHDIALKAESYEAIGRRHNLHKDAVRRHSAHVSKALAKVLAEEAGPRRAVDQLDKLFTRVEAVLSKAENGNNGTLAITAAKELRALVELHARITGELDESTKVQVLNLSTSPDWILTRDAMLDVLHAYPDARNAVASRLLAIEA